MGRGAGGGVGLVISGRVRALNLTVPLGSGRVGSDDLGYGPGSGFSFEPVQTSSGNTIGQDIQTLTYHSSTSNMAFPLKDVCSSNFTWPLNMMLT